MDDSTANEIYDILVNVCGASETMREGFVLHQTSDSPPNEWRFIGHLDFGGKFWNAGGRFYVNCYSEHRNAERERIIEEANGKLARVKARLVPASS